MLKVFLSLMLFITQIDYNADVNDCLKVNDAEKRLTCYDEYHGYLANQRKNESEYAKLKPSNTFPLLPYKPSYFMPVSFNENRNSVFSSAQQSDILELENLETKYQVSFKLPLWKDIMGTDIHLMAAYTQKSFWQMYNSDLSSPFRETNYEPEVFFTKNTDYDILGFTLVNASVGFVHQSNGRGSHFSRSWNRITAQLVFNRKKFVLALKPWWRVREELSEDDNPDIDDYLGYYELGMLYKWNKAELTLLLRNLNSSKHQETYQLGWSIPLNDDINFYIEYFHGYGESLIDYNHMSKSLGFGFSISDWVE